MKLLKYGFAGPVGKIWGELTAKPKPDTNSIRISGVCFPSQDRV